MENYFSLILNLSCETNGNDIFVKSVYWKAFILFFIVFLIYLTWLQELFPVNKRDQDTFVAHFKNVGLGPIADFQVIYEKCLQVVIFAMKFMLLIFLHICYLLIYMYKNCFWFLFGQETQRNYQVKVELKKHVTEMMKDEEPPKEVYKLYQYIDPICKTAFQMIWKETYDHIEMINFFLYQITFAFK